MQQTINCPKEIKETHMNEYISVDISLIFWQPCCGQDWYPDTRIIVSYCKIIVHAADVLNEIFPSIILIFSGKINKNQTLGVLFLF